MRNRTGNPLVDVILADTNEITARVELAELRGKSVLVTGASGLIGTYILSCVKSLNDDVSTPIDLCAVVYHEPPDHYGHLFNDSQKGCVFFSALAIPNPMYLRQPKWKNVCLHSS